MLRLGVWNRLDIRSVIILTYVISALLYESADLALFHFTVCERKFELEKGDYLQQKLLNSYSYQCPYVSISIRSLACLTLGDSIPHMFRIIPMPSEKNSPSATQTTATTITI